MYDLISQIFHGTMSETLKSGNTTLFLSLEHVNVNVRLAALTRINEMLSSHKSETLFLELNESLLNRLNDESDEVVSAVLDLPALHKIDHEILIKRVIGLYEFSKNENIREKALLVALDLLKNHPELDKEFNSSEIFLGSVLNSSNSKVVTAILRKLEVPQKNSELVVKLINGETSSNEVINAEVLKGIVATVISKKEMKSIFIRGLKSKWSSMRYLSFMVIQKLIQDKKNLENSLIAEVLDFFNCASEECMESKFHESIIDFIDSFSALRKNSPVWFDYHESSYEGFVTKFFHFVAKMQNVHFRDSLLKNLISTQLKDTAIEFYASLWNSSEITSIYVSLELASKYITALGKNDTVFDYQLLLPSLLLVLSNKNKKIRKKAIEILETLNVIYGKLFKEASSTSVKASNIYGYSIFYGAKSSYVQYLTGEAAHGLIKFCLDRKNELITDSEYLLNNITSLLSGENGVREDFVCFLLANVLSFSNKRAQEKLISLLSLLDDPLKMRVLFPLLESEFDKLGLDSESENDASLICCLMNCFSSMAVKSLFNSRDPRYRNLYLKVLQNPTSIKAEIACKAAVNLIDVTWFNSINESLQLQIVACLFSLSNTTIFGVVGSVRTVLHNIPISNEIFGQLLSDVNESFNNEPDNCKKQRRDVEEKEESSMTLLISLLELSKSNSKIFFKHTIISRLFEVLNSLLNNYSAKGFPRVEYAKQLLMSNILEVINKLSEKEIQLVTEETLRMDLVVQCVRVTNNPQTHNSALLLLAATGCRYPKIVLVNIMPVFTFMGSSILSQNDSFSFHVIEKTLKTVIPALLKNNENLNQVIYILKMFVNAVSDIPEYRRINLFSVLISTLSENVYLGYLTGLLVTHTIFSPVFSIGDKFDYNKFAMTLLHRYDSEEQFVAFNSIICICRSILSKNTPAIALFGKDGEMDDKLAKKAHIRLINFVMLALKSSQTSEHKMDANRRSHVILVENILGHIDDFEKRSHSINKKNCNSNR